MEQQAQMIVDLWRMFLRQIWVMAFVAFVGVAVSGFVAYILPPVFESEAKILVESQQIPDALARSTITASAAERLQLINQRLMTRDNLVKVIDDLELFTDRIDLNVTQKIALLRKAARLKGIPLDGRRQNRRDATISAFTITVRFNDPKKASDIANEFVTKALDQNLRSRTERATSTLDFFANEEKRLAEALTNIEIEITNFKNENEQSLPSSLEFRRVELARLSQKEFELDQLVLTQDEELAGLRIELDRLERRVIATGRNISPEEQELNRLKLQLSQKRAVFTESHREIKLIKSQIASLEQVVGTRDESGQVVEIDRSDEVLMRRRINFLETQVSLVREQRAGLESQRKVLEQSLAETPKVEMELNALTRRATRLQSQYAAIVAKKSDAETGERLEVNQQAERFEVIENALTPEDPVSPNRQKILALGSGVSIGIALALGILLELLNPAIRSAVQMERKLDLRPVSTIPYIRTAREKAVLRVKVAFIIAFFAIGAPLSLLVIDTYYLPLQLLAERFIDQTGLGEIIFLLENRF
ncbi:MAG: Wzz/FepE/Etk N-terminal domain-containing protein [Pseudomonadota bacterium]